MLYDKSIAILRISIHVLRVEDDLVLHGFSL